ncbi:MAG: hypothetical protein ACOWWM_01505 [Desulfobacterales bacterium]
MTEEKSMICHYCRCLSDYVYWCADCREEFCLNCVPVEDKIVRQVIHCPRCSGTNVTRHDAPPPSA